MFKILVGDTYCPMYKELKMKPCPRPPTRQVLLTKINKAIALKLGESKML